MIAVTGLGMVTPAGIGTAASWAGLLAGQSPATVLDGVPVCQVPGFDADALLGRKTAWRIDRFSQFALVAAREAIADSGLDPSTWDGARVGVVLGNALGGTPAYEKICDTRRDEGPEQVTPLLIPLIGVSMVAGYVSIDLRATGPSLVTVTACASGTTAIGTALGLLRSGACDVVLTGGTEASLSPTILAGFNKMGALSKRVGDPGAASRPFDVDRDGFVAAEGAAILVLERLADAEARQAPIKALLSGYGASADAHHATAPHPDGRGVEAAIRAALQDADLTPSEVDHVNAHGTSTPLNDVSEARVLTRLFGHRPPVTSIKGVTGHSLGAAGAIEAACTVLSLHHGLIPPTANVDSQDPAIDLDVVAKEPRSGRFAAAISNSFGFGGQNAVLAFRRYQ